MDSWWDMGEWSGYRGSELQLFEITCPFCNERGNFKKVFEVKKAKPNSQKALHFDTLQCGSCASYVQVLWSNSASMHDFRVQPWPLKIDKAPEHWPEVIGRYWLQAKRSIKDENWDAATVMARSALQVSLRMQDAKGRNLYDEINDLATKGSLPPLMKEWAHEVREIGNDSAHPVPGQPATQPSDAREIVKFLDFFLEYTYNLPKRIKEYRERENKP